MVEGDVGSYGGDNLEDAPRFRLESGPPVRAFGWGERALSRSTPAPLGNGSSGYCDRLRGTRPAKFTCHTWTRRASESTDVA